MIWELTVNKQRCGRDLVPTVFVGECGGLLNGREVFGGRWRVHMPNLNTRWGRCLDITLRCREKQKRDILKTSLTMIFSKKVVIFLYSFALPLNNTEATSRSEFTWSWMFLLSSSFSDFTKREHTFMSKRLGNINFIPMAFCELASSTEPMLTDGSTLMPVTSGNGHKPSISSDAIVHTGSVIFHRSYKWSWACSINRIKPLWLGDDDCLPYRIKLLYLGYLDIDIYFNGNMWTINCKSYGYIVNVTSMAVFLCHSLSL